MRYFLYILMSIVGIVFLGFMIYLLLGSGAPLFMITQTIRSIGFLFEFLIVIILFVYLRAIFKLGKFSFTKQPITKRSRVAAVFGFLSLVFLLGGVGLIFGFLGVIVSIFGMSNSDRESRKVALYGLFASLTTLLALSSLISMVLYMHATGKIQL